STAAGVLLGAMPREMRAADPAAGKAAVLAQVPKLHAENLRRLQEWIALPSIAAETRNYPQGAEHMAQLAREAGFSGVRIVPTSGKPGVFGVLEADVRSGARSTVAVYFMYDVKQFVPEEWSSPPLEARLVPKDDLGTVCMGRGAVNQKGPQNSFLGALAAFKAAGRKPPVNLVLVAEGEEEIGSPHFGEIVSDPGVTAALGKCIGVLLPSATQERDASVQVELGAKGIIELELVSSGEKWGRGPRKDVHSSLEAQMDSPSWHLVQALNTLVEKDGHTPAVDGLFEHVKPLSDAQKKMVHEYAASVSEDTIKQLYGVSHWVHDLPWEDSLLRLFSQPTVNIEGLVGGYTGPGGKTVLPHRAVAKIDMRLVPDMSASDTLAKLK
ncbi:MAG: M20/M25/M40 family metallo-hydrolase, partial [Proteobacteria bacterium]|nr:M20/M25/M40 family metallo-hydrolase [Pseudomonadota bacterium]